MRWILSPFRSLLTTISILFWIVVLLCGVTSCISVRADYTDANHLVNMIEACNTIGFPVVQIEYSIFGSTTAECRF